MRNLWVFGFIQENAVNLLENTASFIAGKANSSDPAMIETVGKSLLFGIGNILSASSSAAKFDDKKGKNEKENNKNKENDKSKVM